MKIFGVGKSVVKNSETEVFLNLSAVQIVLNFGCTLARAENFHA